MLLAYMTIIYDINEDEGDFQMNFMHPPEPTKNFTIKQIRDMLGITFTCFAKLIHPKQLQVKLRASATVNIKQYLSLSMARDHF